MCAGGFSQSFSGVFLHWYKNFQDPHFDREFRNRQELSVALLLQIAIRKEKPVVWHCAGDGGYGNDSITRLFLVGKYYEWEGITGGIYTSLFQGRHDKSANLLDCWFCLDGVDQERINDRGWQDCYRLLTTTGQFDAKSEDQTLCLLPYWR